MILLDVSLIFLAGLLFGKVLKLLKLPEVTGYLIAGIIIGPYLIGGLSFSSLEILNPLIIVALTFVSFQIGSEFKCKYIKKIGVKPFVISILTSLFTMSLVTTGCLLLDMSLSFSLIVGVIFSSTAPAAILTVIKEYRSRGKLTDTMLSVVAIDDIVSIILFGFVLSFVHFLNGSGEVNVLQPFVEILFSIVLGGSIGLVVGYLSNKFKNDNEVFILIVSFIFILIVLSEYFDLSYMLSAMVMGIVFINSFKYKITDRILHIIDFLSPTLIILLFVLSGASLNITILFNIGLLGLVCILFRTLGKVLGSYISGSLVGFDKNLKKYLGFTLLSQTGIGIGLALVAAPLLGTDGELLINLILASSLIFDIVGPILVKYCLAKNNEIKEF